MTRVADRSARAPSPSGRRVRGALAALGVVGALAPGVAVAAAANGGDEAVGPAPAVVGHVYRSVSVQQDGRPMALFAGAPVWLVVDRRSLGFRGDCNGMGADLRATATRLHVGDIAQTAMGCLPTEREQRDDVLTAFFGRDPGWQLRDGLLVLTAGPTTVTFEQADRPPPLPAENPARPQDLVDATLGTGEYRTWPEGLGESWRGPFLAVDVVRRHGRPFLTMRARCRQLEAPITIRRATLAVGAPRTRTVRCRRWGSDDTLDTARPFFGGAVMWHLEGGRLTLQRSRSTLTLRAR